MRPVRFTPLLVVLVLAACTSSPADMPSDPVAPAPEMEPHPWLVEARALTDDAGFDDADDRVIEARNARRTAFLLEIEEELEWKRACDTYVDYETGEVVYDPQPDDEFAGARGRLNVSDVSETEGLLSISCFFGAYQGSYALVYIDGDRTRLLRAPALDSDMQPMDETEASFAEIWWDDLASGTFFTFSKSRGIGDCGVYKEFEIGEADMLRLLEVRYRDCSPDIPDPLPPPSEWPLVYTAR